MNPVDILALIRLRVKIVRKIQAGWKKFCERPLLYGFIFYLVVVVVNALLEFIWRICNGY